MRIRLSSLFIIIIYFACKNSSGNFPFYKQRIPAESGPTCLKMIVDYYNGKDDIRHIITLTKMDSVKGTTMLDLSNTAEKIGFKSIGVSLTY